MGCEGGEWGVREESGEGCEGGEWGMREESGA